MWPTKSQTFSGGSEDSSVSPGVVKGLDFTTGHIPFAFSSGLDLSKWKLAKEVDGRLQQLVFGSETAFMILP